MRITVIYVGSTSEKFYIEAALEYEKRIGAFGSFQSICIKEERIDDETSSVMVEKALAAEEARIRSAVPKGSVMIALCVEGKSYSSEGLAELVSNYANNGVSSLTFIIGSSHGISKSLKSACHVKISMSSMTFPHMLARVMLTEQIYRALTIINGKNYHK